VWNAQAGLAVWPLMAAARVSTPAMWIWARPMTIARLGTVTTNNRKEPQMLNVKSSNFQNSDIENWRSDLNVRRRRVFDCL
jgi:hypothetical protein